MCIRGTKEITILEMLDKVGKDFGKSTKWTMLQDLKRFGIESRTGAKALEITAEGVRIETAQGIETIAADTVVVAAGAKSNAELAAKIQETGIPFATIGDARQIGMAFDAVHQGFEAAVAV